MGNNAQRVNEAGASFAPFLQFKLYPHERLGGPKIPSVHIGGLQEFTDLNYRRDPLLDTDLPDSVPVPLVPSTPSDTSDVNHRLHDYILYDPHAQPSPLPLALRPSRVILVRKSRNGMVDYV